MQPRRRSAPTWKLLLLLGVACKGPAPTQRESLGPPRLSDVLEGRPADREFDAILVTELGRIRCKLDPRHAPNAVALFVGLSNGRAAHLDPRTKTAVHRPLYERLPFTRAIRKTFIQSGDARGDGSGNPGYRIAVESSPDDAKRLSEPGALVLARYTPPPFRDDPNPPPAGHVLGSQFAVLLGDMRHLAGRVSVLGRCEDLDLAERIGDEVTLGRQPLLQKIELPR